MTEYRVQLDVFRGPMDLLLYLVRKNEVDVADIPIAVIAEQYLQYVSVLQQIDPESAAEFLVMAATLMEIKSRSLLPAAAETEATAGATDTAELADPRGELIRQLLEYKEFKDRAVMLEQRFEKTAQRFPRVPSDWEQQAGGQVEVDLSEIGVWELLAAFERIINQVQISGVHQVVDDDTPIELHIQDVVDRLRRDGSLGFERLFEGRTRKAEVIGQFLAVLELMKQRRVRASRGAEGGIVLELLPEPAAGEPAAPEPAPAPAASAAPEADDAGKKPRKRRTFRKGEDEPVIEREAIREPDPEVTAADDVLANFRLHPPRGDEPATDQRG